MKLPMREKTVDEAVGIWVVIGGAYKEAYVESVGCLTTGDYNIFPSPIPEKKAMAVVKAHSEFRGKLYSILTKEY